MQAAEVYTQIFESAIRLARPELKKMLGIPQPRRAAELPADVEAMIIVHSTATSPKRSKSKVTAPVKAEKAQTLDEQIVEIRKLLTAEYAELAKIQVQIAGHQALLTALFTQHLAT